MSPLPGDNMSFSSISYYDDGRSIERRLPCKHRDDDNVRAEEIDGNMRPNMARPVRTTNAHAAGAATLANMSYMNNTPDFTPPLHRRPGFDIRSNHFNIQPRIMQDDKSPAWPGDMEKAVGGDIWWSSERMRRLKTVAVVDAQQEKHTKREKRRRRQKHGMRQKHGKPVANFDMEKSCSEDEDFVMIQPPMVFGSVTIEGNDGRVVVVDSEGEYDSGPSGQYQSIASRSTTGTDLQQASPSSLKWTDCGPNKLLHGETFLDEEILPLQRRGSTVPKSTLRAEWERAIPKAPDPLLPFIKPYEIYGTWLPHQSLAIPKSPTWSSTSTRSSTSKSLSTHPSASFLPPSAWPSSSSTASRQPSWPETPSDGSTERGIDSKTESLQSWKEIKPRTKRTSQTKSDNWSTVSDSSSESSDGSTIVQTNNHRPHERLWRSHREGQTGTRRITDEMVSDRSADGSPTTWRQVADNFTSSHHLLPTPSPGYNYPQWNSPAITSASPNSAQTVQPYSWRRSVEQESAYSTYGSSRTRSSMKSSKKSAWRPANTEVSWKSANEVPSVRSHSTYRSPTVEDAPESSSETGQGRLDPGDGAWDQRGYGRMDGTWERRRRDPPGSWSTNSGQQGTWRDV